MNNISRQACLKGLFDGPAWATSGQTQVLANSATRSLTGASASACVAPFTGTSHSTELATTSRPRARVTRLHHLDLCCDRLVDLTLETNLALSTKGGNGGVAPVQDMVASEGTTAWDANGKAQHAEHGHRGLQFVRRAHAVAHAVGQLPVSVAVTSAAG